MFDFAECLTRSARLVVPRIAERGLAFTFDVDVPSLTVQGDIDVAERSLHRLLQGALGLIDAGLLAILGSVSDKGMPTVRITGAGALLGGQRLVLALEDLGLSPSGLSKGTLVVARGHCPVAGAPLVLAHDRAEGFVLDATLPFTSTGEALPRLPSANGAVAWVCLPENPRSGVFKRRLQRLGWEVVFFEPDTSLAAAFDRLNHEQPALLLAHARQPTLDADVVDWLRLPVAADVPRVLAVPLGHPALEQLNSGYRLQALPFSPHDLAVLTAAQEPNFDLTSLPVPLADEAGGPRLLIVDDNPVNQAVMGAMAEAMGYAVSQADDGQQAIEACLQAPPSAVLMDVNMPVMDGIEATRHIRALQRSGELAPFPILGASADATPDNAHACLTAGMDTFLAKPLLIAEVAAQLRRLSLDAPKSATW